MTAQGYLRRPLSPLPLFWDRGVTYRTSSGARLAAARRPGKLAGGGKGRGHAGFSSLLRPPLAPQRCLPQASPGVQDPAGSVAATRLAGAYAKGLFPIIFGSVRRGEALWRCAEPVRHDCWFSNPVRTRGTRRHTLATCSSAACLLARRREASKHRPDASFPSILSIYQLTLSCRFETKVHQKPRSVSPSLSSSLVQN
jgi:hypothetical protein